MRDPALKVANIIVGAAIGALGGSSAWGVFVGKQPLAPDANISVREVGGQAPFARYLFDFPEVQVLIRGEANGYQAARQKAEDIKNAVVGNPGGVDADGDNWASFLPTGGVNSLGFDESDRPQFSMNFKIILHPATGTYRQ